MRTEYIDGVLWVYVEIVNPAYKKLDYDSKTFFYGTFFDYVPYTVTITTTFAIGDIVYGEKGRGTVKEIYFEEVLIWWDYFNDLDFAEKIGGELIQFKDILTLSK